jgi:hypothetical protein
MLIIYTYAIAENLKAVIIQSYTELYLGQKNSNTKLP